MRLSLKISHRGQRSHFYLPVSFFTFFVPSPSSTSPPSCRKSGLPENKPRVWKGTRSKGCFYVRETKGCFCHSSAPLVAAGLTAVHPEEAGLTSFSGLHVQPRRTVTVQRAALYTRLLKCSTCPEQKSRTKVSFQCQKTALRFLCAELETHLQVWELFSLGFSSSSGDRFTMQTNGP